MCPAAEIERFIRLGIAVESAGNVELVSMKSSRTVMD